MFVYILLVLILVTIGLWGWWLKIVKNGSGPMLKGSLPIIGYAHKLIGDTEKLYRVITDVSNMTTANGGVSRLILAFNTYYVITDPEDLATAGNYLLKKHFAFDFAKPWLGEGLLTATTSVWKHHRRVLAPAFSPNLLYSFLQVFNDQARQLAVSLAKEVGRGPVEITHYFIENAMSVLSQTLLGLSKHEHTDLLPKYTKAVDAIMEMIVTRFSNVWLHSDLLYKLTGLKKKETDLIRVLHELSDVVIRAKRLQLNDTSDDSNTSVDPEQNSNIFLDRLLKLSASGAMTEKEVREEVDTILVTGVDTSSWLVTYVCIALGTYPEVQHKVVEELTEIFGDSNRDVTKDDLQRLVYMEAVIKETLRLYPIGPVSIRTVENELKLKNCYLRPGDHVVMSFYGMNRHPVWGLDAEQFRPERWLQANSLPSGYAGFGSGKRSCIGKTYATISMKVLLSQLLRRYRVTGDITKLRFKIDFVAKAVAGHLVTISERSQIEADATENQHNMWTRYMWNMCLMWIYGQYV